MQRVIFDEDHHAFRASAKEYADRSLVPRMERVPRGEDLSTAPSGWRPASRASSASTCPRSTAARRVGDYRFNAVFAEEVSKVSASLSSCFGIHYDCAAPYLVDLGTEEQKQRWLPKFCSGELVTAIGMTEPSGGSDLAALKTTAKTATARRGW